MTSNETLEVAGPCPACRVLIAAQYYVEYPSGAGSMGFQNAEGEIGTRLTIQGHDTNSEFRGSLMHRPSFQIPKHLPANVESAFLDAEKCRENGLLNPAAAFYGKAIDRAVTILLKDANLSKSLDRMTLGEKMAELRNTNQLPKPMIDWIKLVNDGRRKGIHREGDEEIQTSDELEAYRRFSDLLLQYLFSLPKEIEGAKAESSVPTPASPKTEDE